MITTPEQRDCGACLWKAAGACAGRAEPCVSFDEDRELAQPTDAGGPMTQTVKAQADWGLTEMTAEQAAATLEEHRQAVLTVLA